MIRAVRHFLRYLEYQSTGGRSAHRSSRPARLDPGAASNEPNARARQARQSVGRGEASGILRMGRAPGDPRLTNR
jgi:hypothetical protein